MTQIRNIIAPELAVKVYNSMTLDTIDRNILICLQENARISNVELADRVGLSPAPCLRRVAALERAGVIRQYVTLLDPETMNLGVTVFVQISLDLQANNRLELFEKTIVKRPEVMECFEMTGDADYLLKVVVTDVSTYERFLRKSLARIEGVAHTRSSFALKQVKYSTALPVVAELAVESRQNLHRRTFQKSAAGKLR